MSDVGERLQLGGEEGADVADVDSSLMWRPHNTEVRKRTTLLALMWRPRNTEVREEDEGDVDSALLWRPNNTEAIEVRIWVTWTPPSCGG